MFCKEEKAWFEDIAAALLFAIILISHLPSIRFLFNLKYSRTNRLILFRAVAHPTFLVTVIPSRVFFEFPGSIKAIKCAL